MIDSSHYRVNNNLILSEGGLYTYYVVEDIVDKILPANRRCALIDRITITEYRMTTRTICQDTFLSTNN